MNVALTIAGSDSGGGAGIQADLHTFAYLGVWGTSAITCLTAQNPEEVTRVDAADPAMVTEQIGTVCRKLPVRAIKIGMTYSAPVIEAIAGALAEHARGIPVVLDPVMRATSGAPLLQPGGDEALIEHLLPLAAVVTPNLAEACVLAGFESIADVPAMEDAARRIAHKSRGAVLVKGGHLDDAATDVLLFDGTVSHLTARRVEAVSTHGTGCSLSSAIAAGLAGGMDVAAAAARAKRFITHVLRAGVRFDGSGHGGLGFVTEGGLFEG